MLPSIKENQKKYETGLKLRDSHHLYVLFLHIVVKSYKLPFQPYLSIQFTVINCIHNIVHFSSQSFPKCFIIMNRNCTHYATTLHPDKQRCLSLFLVKSNQFSVYISLVLIILFIFYIAFSMYQVLC